MFVRSDPRSSYLHGLGALQQMDRRKRYLTGLLQRGVMGSFNPHTRYLSGPAKRRGLFGLGQDDSDSSSIDPFASIDPTTVTTYEQLENLNPNQGIVTNSSGIFNVPYTPTYASDAAPSLNQPISAVPTSANAANVQVLQDVPAGYYINSNGNLASIATGQVVNPSVQYAQAAAAGAQVAGTAAQYVNAAGQVASVPAGYAVNAQGQLVPSSGSSITTWLNSSTLLAGTLNSTVLMYGVLGYAAIALISSKKKKK